MDIKDVKYIYLRDEEGKIITDPEKTLNELHAIINGKPRWIPLDPDNTDYQEILAQVKAGTLTIKDAD